VLLPLCLGVVFGIAGIAAEPAFACNSGNGTKHCYGFGYLYTSNDGASATLNSACLHVDDAFSQIVTNEMWIVGTSPRLNWIESGVLAGDDGYSNNTPRYFAGVAPGTIGADI